jgi:hypothetical protein
MALSTMSTTFGDVTMCSLVQVYRLFGESYCIHLQGSRVSRSSKHSAVLMYRVGGGEVLEFFFLL